MSAKWYKVSCDKCGHDFNNEFAEGTSVYCNKCARWVYVGEEVGVSEGGDKAKAKKV